MSRDGYYLFLHPTLIEHVHHHIVMVVQVQMRIVLITLLAKENLTIFLLFYWVTFYVSTEML